MESTQAIPATCPECRGPMSEVIQTHGQEELREFKCLVGHAYSAKSLLQSHSEVQEKALWAAVVALEEAMNLVRATLAEFPPAVGERLQRQAELKRQQAQELRAVLERLEPFQTD